TAGQVVAAVGTRGRRAYPTVANGSVPDRGSGLREVGERPLADHPIEPGVLGRILHRLRDGAHLGLQPGHAGVDVRLAVERDLRRVERLDARKLLELEDR